VERYGWARYNQGKECGRKAEKRSRRKRKGTASTASYGPTDNFSESIFSTPFTITPGELLIGTAAGLAAVGATSYLTGTSPFTELDYKCFEGAKSAAQWAASGISQGASSLGSALGWSAKEVGSGLSGSAVSGGGTLASLASGARGLMGKVW
jgi:hypothetical protein